MSDSALHGETTIGANREGHRSLAEWRILGGMLSKAQGARAENGCISQAME